jgi:hypothetical protein
MDLIQENGGVVKKAGSGIKRVGVIEEVDYNTKVYKVSKE